MFTKNSLLPIALLSIATVSHCFGSLWAEEKKENFEELPSLLTSKPLAITSDGDELQKLLKGLYNERLALASANYKAWIQGQPGVTLDILLDSVRRLLHTGLTVDTLPEGKTNLLKQMLEFAAKVEKLADHMREQRGQPVGRDNILSREFKREIEIEILKNKKSPPKKE